MNDSVKLLAEFVSGLVTYSDFQDKVVCADISKELLEYIPLEMVDEIIVQISPTSSEQLDARDELRNLGEKSDILASQFKKIRLNVFDCVKSKIHAAFDKVALGRGVTLAQANAIDNYQPEEGQLIARKTDIDIPWQHYPEKDLEDFTALVHLDLEGFTYYLPAYLIWCVDNCMNDPYSNIASQAFGALDTELSSFKTHLSTEQENAVIDFLWLFAIYSDSFRDDCISGLIGIGKTNLLVQKFMFSNGKRG